MSSIESIFTKNKKKKKKGNRALALDVSILFIWVYFTTVQMCSDLLAAPNWHRMPHLSLARQRTLHWRVKYLFWVVVEAGWMMWKKKRCTREGRRWVYKFEEYLFHLCASVWKIGEETCSLSDWCLLYCLSCLYATWLVVGLFNVWALCVALFVDVFLDERAVTRW